MVSTIKGYRSAIAGVFRSAKVPDLTSDPDISGLFAGFLIERPVDPMLIRIMLMRFAINEITIFCSISVIMCDSSIRPVSTPMFTWSGNTIMTI